MEEILLPLVVKFNEYLSNYILVTLLIGVGIFYTFRTRFVQVRCFLEGFKNMFSGLNIFDKAKNHSMTSFQALSTAVAAQVGTGNIIGSSSAILIGGPGAIFWMWVIAFFGMATIYAEATLAIKTRTIEKDGTIKGGPVYYIREAFKGKFGKFLAGFFALAITLALGFMGCMVQSNSIVCCMETAFNIKPVILGVLLVIACAVIFIGGIKRLASVVEKIVPLMALLFIIGCFIILIVRLKYIPETFYIIFKYAFEPQAIIGGGFGHAFKVALSQGVKRGLFSNEAGMGSTPHAHALANVTSAHTQGTVAMLGVFIDTFVVLTLNALIVISTLYTNGGMLQDGYTEAVMDILNKTNLVQTAFGSVFGHSIGAVFVAVCLFFFAFSSILSWNLFGKINVIYLFRKFNSKIPTTVYTIIALFFIMLGSLISSDFVWELTDMFNNLMVIPNVIALFALSSTVVLISKNKT